MSNEKFTQGEWHIWKDKSTIPFIFGKDGYAIACMCGKQKDYSVIGCLDDYLEPEKVLANAYLIAAAPEMYECICDALTDLQMLDGMRNHFEAVLKKARGQAEGENK